LEGSTKIGLEVCEAKIRLQAVVNKIVKISSSINGVKFLDELRDFVTLTLKPYEEGRSA
jgi:hypothetical protein